MSAALIAQLLAQFGPAAFSLIKELAAIWSKPSLTVEEVVLFCDKAKKSYDDYVSEARATALKPVV
jgi:hypothetical protein